MSPADTANLISIFAVAVAAIALCLSIAEVTANRPRLRITHWTGLGVGGIGGDWLSVNVINWGRQPLTILSLSIELTTLKGKDGVPCHAVHMPSGLGNDIPHFLEVGREAKFLFRLDVDVADITTTEIGSKSLKQLMDKHGAVAKLSTSWHRKPVRRRLHAKAKQ